MATITKSHPFFLIRFSPSWYPYAAARRTTHPSDNPQTASIETANGGYELLHERRSEGLIARFFVALRHVLGLIFGYDLRLYPGTKSAGARDGVFGVILLRIPLFFAWPFLDRSLIKQPFPVQFRRRLEMLGPTYIKLGQILSLREDLLPKVDHR